MARNDKHSIAAKASIRLRFRRDARGLIYSRIPGGEGRVIADAEAVRFVQAFDNDIDDAALQLKRWVILSFVMPVPLGIAARIFFNPAIAAVVAIMALASWMGAFIVLRARRWRLVQNFWISIERRPSVAALSRQERISRGLALGLQGWLILVCFVAVLIAIKAPAAVFPEPWRASHMMVRGMLLAFSAVGFAAVGVARLIGRRQNAY